MQNGTSDGLANNVTVDDGANMTTAQMLLSTTLTLLNATLSPNVHPTSTPVLGTTTPVIGDVPLFLPIAYVSMAFGCMFLFIALAYFYLTSY